MTLNIISRQFSKPRITGPKKVLVNACKGLDKIGVKYIFNKPISNHEYNWIHDDQRAIIEASLLRKPVLVGPNTAVLPKDLPILRPKLHKESIYLHPSDWCIDVWRYFGEFECEIKSWPVGIDDYEIKERDRGKIEKNRVLVYFKERNGELLNKTVEMLQRLEFEYTLIHYGYYKQDDYLEALQKCSFGIWIGRQESQGIALQEALTAGLPLIVLDATSIFDTVNEGKKGYFDYEFPQELKIIKSTSAPYFDERCGIKIEKIEELEGAIQKIVSQIDSFNPRGYILENLSLEASAKKLISFFESMETKKSSNFVAYPLSHPLFYADLLTKKWFYKWVWHKIKNKAPPSKRLLIR